MRASLIALAAGFLGVAGCGAQTLEREIRAEVARYVETVNAGDPAALAALYLRDPASSSIGDGQISRGWVGVSQLMDEIYTVAGSIRMTLLDSVTVTPLGDAAAIAFFRYRWVLGDETTSDGAMSIVYWRASDGWRVAHDHTSTLPAGTVLRPHVTAATDGPPRPIRETFRCNLTRIIDGDTIECRAIGRIRLIGMDTPERNQAPYGGQATQALTALLGDASLIEIEPDVEPRDRYGRVLGYVWADGVMVNWALVRRGFAVILTYPPNVQYVDWLTDAQRLARKDAIGLWASGGFDCLPRDHRRGRC